MLSSLPLALMAALSSLSFALCADNSTVPAAPKLEYLYTAYVDCANDLLDGATGPSGARKAIPITGGNFTGPRVSGKVLNVGADWGTTDPRTGIFTADTRYQLKTNDGADLFLRTSGPVASFGGLQLRIVIETGDDRYYWLNNIVAIGELRPVVFTATGNTLRIDAWAMLPAPANTTFINGTKTRR